MSDDIPTLPHVCIPEDVDIDRTTTTGNAPIVQAPAAPEPAAGPSAAPAPAHRVSLGTLPLRKQVDSLTEDLQDARRRIAALEQERVTQPQSIEFVPLRPLDATRINGNWRPLEH